MVTLTLMFASFQLVLGLPLERMHGWCRVMQIYLAGVLTGSLTHAVFEPNLIAVGASAGGYALQIAHFANAICNWQEMKLPGSGVSRRRFIVIAGYNVFELYCVLSMYYG